MKKGSGLPWIPDGKGGLKAKLDGKTLVIAKTCDGGYDWIVWAGGTKLANDHVFGLGMAKAAIADWA